MRLFLAIDISEKIKKELTEQLSELKKEHKNYVWVEELNYHLTLLFLGEVANTNKLKEKVKAAVYDKEHFYLYSTNVDLFIHDKITIYLGFRRNKILENIVESIKKELQIFDDKIFSPHMTLARCRVPSKQQYFVLKKQLAKQDIQIEFPVKKIFLFQSTLNLNRPVYKKIASFNLL